MAKLRAKEVTMQTKKAKTRTQPTRVKNRVAKKVVRDADQTSCERTLADHIASFVPR
jgi:hypothetical protein